ncbi:hypothetical protein, conserved [Thermococcus kodakarensis KOD1]|uniref:Uncharacterized protein n=1 Tax=Thermococcus kodakarensis (strain ATCC BAA-918 / JCM 12380 / KOD1) TaxID=69014 RepID=Q5JD83_THEKO|nr:hypothetical protein [Thermococcus kodakarensis]WCN28544.1 hypothetical protein POG15_02485 [Thermococcus kodakarensis]WCN30841.1 hypothetical protein POG21_02485 [Thermococcus kodakarensis]BAD84674.1 hypothetical protein, conserved [Thermococcus kodakarensis KOD1]
MRCKLRGKFIEVEIDLESFEPDPFPGRFPILFLVAGHEVGGYHNEGWLGDSYGLFQDLLLCTRDLLKCPESCFNKRKNAESDGFKLLPDSYVCGPILDLDFNTYYLERKGELLRFHFINEAPKYISSKNSLQGTIELPFGAFVADILKISEEYLEKCFPIEMETKAMQYNRFTEEISRLRQYLENLIQEIKTELDFGH